MSDYNFLMESRLSPAQFQFVNDLSRIAHSEELNLYLAGGVVRDMTYGQASLRGLDFAVEGDIAKLLHHFQIGGASAKKPAKGLNGAAQAAVIRSKWDKRLMTAELRLSNGVYAEISRCREEVFSKPGRLPEISPAMIFDDLKRRDFAINAMAVSLHPNSRGLLLDPKNGVSDIERREIRALHSRSFQEEPSRMYRLLRLSLRLGFKPEEKTQRWFDTALAEKAWQNVAPEYQGRELEAVLREENPERVLKLYADKGILNGLDKNLGRLSREAFNKVRALARKMPSADLFLLNFDALVSDLNAPQKKRMAEKILGDPEMVKLALNLERDAKKVAQLLSGAKYSLPSHAFKLLSAQPEPVLLYLVAYFPNEKVQSRLKNFFIKAPQIRSRLPRQELHGLGVQPGPKFDEILERLFFDELDGKIRTPQQLAREMRHLAGVPEGPLHPEAKRPKEPAATAELPKSAAAVLRPKARKRTA